MGMYDTFSFAIENYFKGFKGEFKDLVFQTKSFDKHLDHYDVEDGVLYRSRLYTGFGRNVENAKRRKYNHTGFVTIYTFYKRSNNQFWLEFIIHFVNGELIDIHLASKEPYFLGFI